jgi:hypothetical protein
MRVREGGLPAFSGAVSTAGPPTAGPPTAGLPTAGSLTAGSPTTGSTTTAAPTAGSPTAGPSGDHLPLPLVPTVATRGEGIAALEDAIARCLIGDADAPGIDTESVLVSNVRHQARLEAAVEATAHAREAVLAGLPLDVVAVDVKIAAEALGEITGETVTEETISQIFARFCVGK